uniref:Uncharacterized protein n=1 Tax=Leersia perrieri TaxID=77586 RepID=A0A0D9X3M3_9ORYZ
MGWNYPNSQVPIAFYEIARISIAEEKGHAFNVSCAVGIGSVALCDDPAWACQASVDSAGITDFPLQCNGLANHGGGCIAAKPPLRVAERVGSAADWIRSGANRSEIGGSGWVLRRAVLEGGDRVSRFPHTLCAPLLTLSCPSPLDLLPPSSSTTDSVLGWRCAEATVAESSPCQNLLSLPCQIASAVLPQVRLILPTTGRPASPSIPSPPPVSNQIWLN